MLRCSATDVQLRRDEDSGKPCEEIEALYSILVSTQDSKPLVAAIRSLLLPNCEGSHSVRVLFFDVTNILTKYSGISSGLMRFQLLRTDSSTIFLINFYYQTGHPGLLGFHSKRFRGYIVVSISFSIGNGY